MNYVMTYGYNNKSLISYIKSIDIMSYFMWVHNCSISLNYYKYSVIYYDKIFFRRSITTKKIYSWKVPLKK